jgi:hypothetical protein
MHKREEIIAAIKKCAERLGRAPSQAEFWRASKISWYQVYKHFRGMRQAVRAAGLEPGPRGSALDVNALTLDWAGVVRKLGRLPSRAEYCEHGIHHAGTLHARIVWSQMAHKFVLLVREFHQEREWADVVKIVVGKFPLLGQLATSNWQKTFTAEDATDEERKTYHGGTETRRTEEMEYDLGPSLAVNAPLVQDDSLMRGDFAPRGFDHGGMRLGKVVAAALAIEILMATARGAQLSGMKSTQQSAVSNQPEDSNWQKAFTAEDAKTPHQAKTGLAGGPGGATEEERKTYHGGAETRRTEEIERMPLIATDNTDRQHGRLQNAEEAEGLGDKHGACGAGRTACGRPVVYGEPLGLAAMAHAPTNEMGVLFLFGILAADLGFRVDRVQAAFPDCEAKREVAPGKWEGVLVELELYSRNFKSHRHDSRGCHVIVCWKHNWPDCPEWLEVIELSKVVKRLCDREIW